jgi:putative lipoprotein (rSAM/lipoprotein system)
MKNVSIKIISGLCIAFGIVSCEVEVVPPPNPPEIPTVSYRMSGTVVDGETQQAIAGIETDMVQIIRVNDMDVESAPALAVLTDGAGYAELTLQTIGLPATDSVVFHVRFYDVDGAVNGFYADSVHRSVIYYPTYTGGSEWYGGEAAGSFGTIELRSW